MRGAMRNATSVEFGGRFVEICATSSRAFRPGFTARRKRIEAELGEYAILAGERDRIGNGRDGDHFHKRQQHTRLIFFIEAALHQSLRDFERHAGAAKLFIRILASRLIGIDDRMRLGHAIGSGQVMVGNDEIDAEAMRSFGGSEGADAHVHTDDESNAGGRGALDHIVAHDRSLRECDAGHESRRCRRRVRWQFSE